MLSLGMINIIIPHIIKYNSTKEEGILILLETLSVEAVFVHAFLKQRYMYLHH